MARGLALIVGSSLVLDLILTFKVTESRFDRDSGESEEGEEEGGEGTPQSNAMTEGEYVPDSPAVSPIELKQELPKYLPALQVSSVLWQTPPALGGHLPPHSAQEPQKDLKAPWEGWQ